MQQTLAAKTLVPQQAAKLPAPLPLDPSLLRLVSGGDSLPKKTW